MPMLNVHNISSNDATKVAQKVGFILVRQKGSHLVLRNPNGKILVIPKHKKLKTGTVLQIIKLLGLTKESFLDMI